MTRYLTIVTVLLFVVIFGINCELLASSNPASQVSFGAPFDEVVVESSLYVRPKNSGRESRTRNRGEDIDASARVALPNPETRPKREGPAPPVQIGRYIAELSQGQGSSLT